MAKKRLAYALSAAALIAGSGFFVPFGAFAEGNYTTLESCEGIENCSVVTSTAELSEAFDAKKSTIIVGSSFDLTADLYPEEDFALYLNNNTITSDGLSFVAYGEMTIYAGENGKIEETSGAWAPLYIYDGLVLESGTIEAAGVVVYAGGDGVEFTMNGGRIVGGSSTATTVNVTDGAKMIMNGGEIDGDTWGVSVFENSELVMNGGMITAESSEGIGVSGNGSASGNNAGTNAKLTLNAGTISSGDLGVYAPQINGTTVLGEGLSINAGKCGVEIRAGELTVAGATITVDANATYEFNPNGSGSTASGVAIAVAQHTTQQAITATVSDGVFTAPVVFAEGNPQHNPEESVEKVELSITGGTFNATNGDPIVSSEDVLGFVTGGEYNKDLEAKYVAEGYVSAYDPDDNSYKVVDPNNMEDPTKEVETYVNEETGEEEHYIAPIEIDYEDSWIEDYGDEEGHISATVEFGDTLMADRKATLSATIVEDADNLVLTGGGELLGAVDLSMLDRDGEIIEVDENTLRVYIDIDEETYNKLAEYDKLYAVYFNEDGEEVERFEAELKTESYDYVDEETGETETVTFYWVEFETTHLSTYGIVGVNETEEAAAPDTGTVTAAGASVKSAAIVTAIAVGLLTSIISFAYLIRRR
ncbi:hypothetical protein IJH15_01760 [Candidatus Saccharibacteria bacterium]|nr:hypothetical protein [Candidatus Saccharibacteria bacterium]